jgi:uncharacterized membrane protein (DUF485 family)
MHAGADGDEEPRTRTRLDAVLFAAYVVAYATFMALLALAPETLGRRVLGGVNLAVAYGMGLIVGAVVLAGLSVLAGRGGARR